MLMILNFLLLGIIVHKLFPHQAAVSIVNAMITKVYRNIPFSTFITLIEMIFMPTLVKKQNIKIRKNSCELSNHMKNAENYFPHKITNQKWLVWKIKKMRKCFNIRPQPSQLFRKKRKEIPITVQKLSKSFQVQRKWIM
jgi:hypothetical protein